MKVADLKPGEYHEFYQGYIKKLPGDKTLGSLLRENNKEIRDMLRMLTPEKLSHRYAEGKWSVAELVQHMIDAERIFQYRALCIARKDETSFPGFDHDAYVLASEAHRRKLDHFIEEFKNVRNSAINLYDSFSEVMLQRIGLVNSSPTSVGAIGFITVGHAKHHLEIMKKNYLL